MKHINLWTVYYMSTNSKGDVWTQADFLDNKITSNLVGKPKLRLTIAIKELRILTSKEKLYLVCQYNTNSRWNSLPIPTSLQRQDPKVHGFVAPINIRIASEIEFKNYKKTLLVDKNERKPYLNSIWEKLNNDSWLGWRLQTIQEVMNGKYDNYNQKALKQLIHYSQFDPIEKKQRK